MAEHSDVASAACVSIVGAGPGDPELITLKALHRLQSADVVLYDRLVAPELLDQLPPGVARIYVGKADGRHTVPQQTINRLLVGLARAGYRVVRLKGGDPFLFGRGGEEALHLARHGVPFEVIPGVTAATACAAAAGIPLTHRGLASGVQFVTGHPQAGADSELDWQRLADPDQTLVIYMGLGRLAQICGRLIDAGLTPATPAAAIENGTTARQQEIVTTLGGLPGAVAARRLRAPVLVVIGRVVELAEILGRAPARPRLRAQPVSLHG